MGSTATEDKYTNRVNKLVDSLANSCGVIAIIAQLTTLVKYTGCRQRYAMG